MSRDKAPFRKFSYGAHKEQYHTTSYFILISQNCNLSFKEMRYYIITTAEHTAQCLLFLHNNTSPYRQGVFLPFFVPAIMTRRTHICGFSLCRDIFVTACVT